MFKIVKKTIRLMLEKIIIMLIQSTFVRYVVTRTIHSQICHSQDGEDIILNSLMNDPMNTHKGFYIDIGAHHPIIYSNTQNFYEKGWTGINIDARPGSMELFNKVRPKDINLEIGISDTGEELLYYSFEHSVFNSFDQKVSEERIKEGIAFLKTIPIKTQTINKILEENVPPNKKIDFITMDVEGFELSILEKFDFEKYSPHFFLIEELYLEDSNILHTENSPIYKLLNSKGYIPVGKTKRTLIYQKTDFDKQ